MGTIIITRLDSNLRIETDDIEQAAALVRILEGDAPAPAASSPGEKPARKARRKKLEEEETSVRRQTGGRGAVKAQVLALLAKDPEIAPKDLAQRVYGDDSATAVNRMRTALYGYERTGAIKRIPGGGWKVI